ncbi:MAG TPA: aldose epimerase [Rhodanobacteraceae bacterium]|nr:aldose epimerase [Rhodanobacteraceae bacterium]
MAQFRAERSAIGAQPIVVLTDAQRQRRVRIACRGAALLGFEVPRAGTPFDLAWGYRDAAEIVARDGSHFAIMAPFPGRIGDARYEFDGHAYDLAPGVTGPREVRHGFVRDADFDVEQLVADAGAARLTLATQAIRPRAGYPFAIDLAVEFMLDPAGLTLAAHMHNVGEHAAPCYFGWHAYFRAGPGLSNDWTLEIPAYTTVRTDDKLIVLPGVAAYAPLDSTPELDFRAPRRVGAQVLDNAYTHLVADADGRIRTRLADPASGFGFTVWQERGVMHAFTGDTLGAGARSAIALEPMECLANAFTRPDCADAIRLAPDALRTFRCGIELPQD